MPQCDVKTRYIPATFAWTILLGTTFLFFYYPCQYYIFRQPWVPAYQGAITFFVLANFTLATFMDPGVIPKAPPDEDREDDFRAPLYKNVEINGITVRMKWCVTCKFYRPPRCSHCSVCNHCIETFDHHCPWVNNCIGRRNYRFFFFFLISLSIHMISIFSLCLIYVLHSKDKLGQVEPIVAMVLMGIVTLLAIPIFGLTGFHMVLVSRGRTTNEQVTGKFKGGYNPFSRGCWNNCCYAQFGPQYPSLMKPSKYASKRAQQMAGVATIHQDNAQVKTLTYLDNGHSHPTRTQHPHYNKLSPGRDNSDTDMDPMASVSQDCEATPPLLRHPGHPPPHPLAHMGGMGSQNNFYPHPLHQGDGQSPRQPQRAGQYPAIVRHSPHTRQRVLDGGRSYTPEVTSPSEQMGHREQPVPTTQQRMRALGVATPLALSSPVRRSNPGTPTQPRRPDFIGVSNAPNVPASYYDFQQSAVQPRGPVQGSPQRRFLSEGELVRQNSELSYPRSNTTVDNIRELAGSPQKGVYMWKDTSPSTYQSSNNTQKHGFEYYRSNPTSPIQQPPPQQQQQQQQHQQQQQQHQQQLPMNQGNNGPMQVAHSRPYHPALRGGVAVFPPSPQVKRKLTPSTAVPNVPGRRPISFVRALEMTDNIEMTDAPIPEHRNNRSTTPTPDRASVYDMNYEISV